MSGQDGKGGLVSARARVGMGGVHLPYLRAIPPQDSYGEPVKRSPVETRLEVQCWCQRQVVLVYESQIVLGRTASCGHRQCTAPTGYTEAKRKCNECGDWFTPATVSRRLCNPCQAARTLGY